MLERTNYLGMEGQTEMGGDTNHLVNEERVGKDAIRATVPGRQENVPQAAMPKAFEF